MAMSFPNESPDYRAAREKLLQEEIALRRAMEAVAAARRKLPPGGLIPEDYVFDGMGADGDPVRVKLSELFAPGKDSLVIYNFMFPVMPQDERTPPSELPRPRREDGPCSACTALLDSLDGAAKHLEGGGVNFVVIAKAPIERLVAFAGGRGWRDLRLLSAAGNTFKSDYRCETPEGMQLPMITVFHRNGGQIQHSWSTEMLFAGGDPGQDPRHTGTIEPLWNIFDLTPEGRPADWEEQLSYDCCSAYTHFPGDGFVSVAPGA